MKINGKIHCMFEQSGTFKNAFKTLGFDAYDYDIQNNFGETDYVIDLFSEIVNAYDNKPSIFDSISKDDLTIAFFPCIFFCENNQLYFTGKHWNLRSKTSRGKAEVILKRSQDRQRMYELCLKLFTIYDERGLRLIVENPYATQHFLVENFPYKANIIDYDRRMRGDSYKKPTQYFFVNCTPTRGETISKTTEVKTVRESASGARAGLCSEERSMISKDYANNFISDFVLGAPQDNGKLQQSDMFN